MDNCWISLDGSSRATTVCGHNIGLACINSRCDRACLSHTYRYAFPGVKARCTIPTTMDSDPPEIPTDLSSECSLLVAYINSALRNLERVNGDSQRRLAALESAVHTYGSVKHLLPKLGLSGLQRSRVEEQLQALRARILAHNGLNEGQ
jgi:hypothetical protein